MEHHHHHHVHPTPDMQKLNRSFIVGIVLNIVFVLAEAGQGFIMIRWPCYPMRVIT